MTGWSDTFMQGPPAVQHRHRAGLQLAEAILPSCQPAWGAIQDYVTFLTYGRGGRWSSRGNAANGRFTHFIIWNEVGPALFFVQEDVLRSGMHGCCNDLQATL